jgi:hypothetical protein
MRVLVDSVVAMLLAAVLGGVLVYERADQERDEAVQSARESVRRIGEEIRLRAATGQTQLNGRGWPVTVDPEWFDRSIPQNLLLSADRPWLEIASPEEANLLHPPVRIATDRDVAAFWYNPGMGVVRARVPVQISDRSTTTLYNEINAADLDSIFERHGAPAAVEAVEDELAPVDAPPDVEYDFEEYGDLDPTRPLQKDSEG